MVSAQCLKYLEEAGLVHSRNKKRCLAMTEDLIDALADSIEAMDPAIFRGRFYPYLEKGAGGRVSSDIAYILISIERTVMGLKLDEAQARFLWPLFHQARTMTMKIQARGGKKPQSAVEGPSEETLSELKNEITERKRVEEELRESERKFRDIAEFTPQVVFEMDARGTVTFANRQAYNIYGYTPEDFDAGINAFDLIHPEDLPRIKSVLRNIAEGALSTGSEYNAVRKDGSTFPVISHSARIMKDGRFVGWRGIIIDITERKGAEEELRQSRQFLQRIADSIPGVIYQFYARPDGEMGLSYLSGSSKEFFGIDANAPDAFEQFLEGLTPSGKEGFLESIREAIAKECDWQFEGEFIKPSGEAMSFTGISSPAKKGNTLLFNGVLLDITARKHAEEKLRESERKFRDIAELSPQAIFEQNADGVITFSNKQGLELFGYTEEDLQKGTVKAMDLFPESERPTVRENLAKIVSGERGTTGYEYTVQRKDGTTFSAIIYTTAIFRNGKLAGFRGVLVDITRLKKTDEELRERERRFRDLAELMPQVIFEMDEKGTITFANKQAFEIFGYSEHDLSGGINAFSLFPAEELPRLTANLQKIAEGERSAGNEYTAYKKDGASFPVIIHVTRIMQEGRLAGYRGIIIDVTEQKRAQRSIEESEKMYRTFFDSTTDFVFLKDEKLHYILVNKALADFFGKKEHEILGMTDFALMPLEGASNCHQTDLKALEAAAVNVSREAVGDRIFETLKFPVEIAKGKTGIGGFIRDITERTMAEEALKSTTEELNMYFTNALDLFCIADTEGFFRRLNNAWETTLGFPLEELEGYRFLDLVHPDDMDATLQALSRLKQQMEVSNFTNRYRCKNGSYRWIEWRSYPAGKQIFAAARDITDRKLAEKALMESEKRLRQIIDLVPHFIFAKDIDGRFILANKAVSDTYGTTVENLIGKTDAQFTPSGEELDRFRSDDMDVISKGITKSIPEETITDSRGAVRFLQTIKIPFTFSGTETPSVLGVSVDITEWKKAQRKIIESEQALRATLAASPIGIGRVRGRIFEWVNEAMHGITGYNLSELVGTSVRFLYETDDEFHRVGEALYRDGQVQTWWARKDSGIREILLQVSPTDNNAYIVTASDITQLKRNEEILRLNESRTQALLRLNQMGDRPLEEITDHTLEESVRLTKSTVGYMAFYDEKEKTLTIRAWSKSVMENCRIKDKLTVYPLEMTGISGEPIRLRKPVIMNDFPAPDPLKKGYPDGHVSIKRYLGVPIFDEEKIVAVIGVANKEEEYDESDINQLTLMMQGMVRFLKQKAAGEALGISESRLRAIIESARDSIFIKDAGLRYIVANRAMSELFGIPIDRIIGSTDKELFGAETGSHIEDVDRKVLRGETIEEEPTKPAGGSMRTFHTIKVPLKNDRGEIVGLCGIARDITERKHLESQLIHSQKMEAIGTLAGGVAHDFNNLLSAIMGYASLLQLKMDRDGPLQSYVAQILLSSEKAANLTQSLLAFSRKQVINLKPLVINDAVEKLHRLLHRLIPEDVEFRIDKTPERLIALGDAGQIDQVIMNLVTNARDSMPQGGKLTIRVDRALINDGFITTHGYGKLGEYALITVSDTGTGMDEKTVEKIFEPFFTTKEVGKGTGLGLSIVYGIVKQHNGFIEVNSRHGKGSSFLVYLPLVWLEPADETAHEEITGGSETILVAEDNDELRALSVNVLKDSGYTILAAGNGAEAVETFRLHRDNIALTILDVVMPKMNGAEAFEAIKELDPSARVIFTSGYTDDIIEERGMDNEKYDFLGKPVTPAALLRKIREVLDRE